mgnify:CR=1 FL=1
MKQNLLYVKQYFTIWWVPLTANLLPIAVFFLGMLLRRDWIIHLSLIVFFLNVAGTVVSSIVQVIQRKWYFVFPQLGCAGILMFYVGMLFMYSPPDYYGAHKEIPDGLDFSYPLDSPPGNKEYQIHDLVLINDIQPGLYTYRTDYVPNKPGYFYIKAFEINSNDPLSKDRLSGRSRIVVNDSETKIRQGAFTIYEGDWGDEYGSRIELWYQPTNGKAYKIEERNFIIEGWQR